VLGIWDVGLVEWSLGRQIEFARHVENGINTETTPTVKSVLMRSKHSSLSLVPNDLSVRNVENDTESNEHFVQLSAGSNQYKIIMNQPTVLCVARYL
jgi:hypothetical protein